MNIKLYALPASLESSRTGFTFILSFVDRSLSFLVEITHSQCTKSSMLYVQHEILDEKIKIMNALEIEADQWISFF